MSHTKEIECLPKKQAKLEQEQTLLERTKSVKKNRSPVRSYDMDDLIKLTSSIMSEEKK